MSDPITEAEYLGNNILAIEAVRAARERSMAMHPARRESERREAAAQQAADLTLAAEATLRRASYLLERAEPLAETLGAAAAAVSHLVEALQCEQAANQPVTRRTNEEGE
ncbi:hypothetical protein ACTXOR_08770 [Arthrobacter rhombi]|uniref:hypothetical protein n=1 Tax=Arthrobacter rhombi TaxID=71253 RepID=UPI003FD55849